MTESKKTIITYKPTGYEFVETNGVETRYYGLHLVAYAFELYDEWLNGCFIHYEMPERKVLARRTPRAESPWVTPHWLRFSTVVKRKHPRRYKDILVAWFETEFSGTIEGKKKLLKEIFYGLENNLHSCHEGIWNKGERQ